MEFEGDCAKLWSKIGSFRQCRTEYLKSIKTGQEKKSLVFIFLYFLTATAKV